MKEIRQIANKMIEEVEEMLGDAKSVIEKEFSKEGSRKALKRLGEYLYEEGIGTIFYTAGDMQSITKPTGGSMQADRNSQKRKDDCGKYKYRSNKVDEMYEAHGVGDMELKAQIVNEVMKRLEKMGKEE